MAAPGTLSTKCSSAQKQLPWQHMAASRQRTPKLAHSDGQTSGSGALLQLSLGFPGCLVGMHQPRNLCPWNDLGLPGICGHLSGPRQCGQRLLQGWLQRPMWSCPKCARSEQMKLLGVVRNNICQNIERTSLAMMCRTIERRNGKLHWRKQTQSPLKKHIWSVTWNSVYHPNSLLHFKKTNSAVLFLEREILCSHFEKFPSKVMSFKICRGHTAARKRGIFLIHPFIFCFELFCDVHPTLVSNVQVFVVLEKNLQNPFFVQR